MYGECFTDTLYTVCIECVYCIVIMLRNSDDSV